MIEFEYRGLRADGQPCQGTVRGINDQAVRLKLIGQGISPLDVRAASGSPTAAATRKGTRLKREEVLLFTRELSYLKEASMPLDRAMAVLKEGAASEGLRVLVTDVAAGIKGGKTLYQALSPFEADLGRQYLVMIKAGESAGSLHIVLKELAEQLEASAKLRGYLASALTYPAILLVVAVLSVVLLLAFVVPQFREIFDSMGEALPFSTRLVLAVSDGLRTHWMVIALIFSLGALAIDRWRRTPHGRSSLDAWVLRLPIMGGVVTELQLAIYFRTMGMLLQRGVPLLDALRISVDALSNAALHKDVEPVSDMVKSGRKYSDSIKGGVLAGRGVVQLVKVAEETGRLDVTLRNIGTRFEDDSRRRMGQMLSIIEPLIIISLGALVAFIIIAILGGVLSINETI